MIWMILDIWEVEIEIISGFRAIGKLQYTGIYGKFNRRDKLWLGNKFDDDKIDDDVDNYYLCGGSNNMPRDY